MILAHNLKHVFFDIERAIDVFMDREKNKNWDEDEEYRDELYYMTQEQRLFEIRGINMVEEEEVGEEIGGEEENMEVEHRAGEIEGDVIECIEIDSDT